MSGEDYSTLWLPNSMMRERAEVPATSVEALKYVTGYLKPIYIDTMEDGRRVAALPERALERVRAGYACGECWATFDRLFDKCPGCGHSFDLTLDIVDYHPDYWNPSPATVNQVN